MHFQRSVKRVSDRVNKGSSTRAYKAFTTIAYSIPTSKSKADVETLFKVLCGEKPLSEAIRIMPGSSVLKEFQAEYNMENWKSCSHWCEWWMRPNHLSKNAIQLQNNTMKAMQPKLLDMYNSMYVTETLILILCVCVLPCRDAVCMPFCHGPSTV